MNIKSVKSFRLKYKTEEKEIDIDNKQYNEDFIGTYHQKENGKKVKGFFEMYHGHKPDIEGYLPSILKIAEDGQAIYEFLQNAVDCDSSHFYIFYNEKYFLAINNGEAFNSDGLRSVLNIAQTTKRSCDQIGRFGIGFKLAHRLVGKSEGVEELVRDNKGPILFSWSNPEDLEKLRRDESIVQITEASHPESFSEAPYLLKIILTNFPAAPGETAKNLQYNNEVLFPNSELKELSTFINESFDLHGDNLKKSDLQQGSLFFIKLGEGKKAMLDKDYEDLKTGVQYSMNTLKNLKKVYIKSEEIQKQTLQLEEFEICKDSTEFGEINPEYKDCNIKVAFGYSEDYEISQSLKISPNFYKYFPMGDEVNGFSFILHCDSFSNESNRRKLQHDHVNLKLLPVIVSRIIERLEQYKTTNRPQFLTLYKSLLLSDIPNNKNNEWLKSNFYNLLHGYIKHNIPTKNNLFLNSADAVKINMLQADFNLQDFGIEDIKWFEWDKNNGKKIIEEAKNEDKLNLKKWRFSDLINNCNVDATNIFFLKSKNESPKEKYQDIIKEVDSIPLSRWKEDDYKFYKNFSKLVFFTYKKGDQKSLASLNNCKINNVIFLTLKDSFLHEVLEKLNFTVSSSYLKKIKRSIA